MKGRRFLFDAGAISLYYAGDSRVRGYFEDVFSHKAKGFLSEVNLAEFYYKSAEKLGLETADAWYNQIRRSEIEAVAPNEEITKGAARLKVKHRHKLSLADCFGIATAKSLRASMITTDERIRRVREVETIFLPVDGEGRGER